MSTNRAIDFKSPRKPTGAFFHWGAPGEPIAVHFHLNIVDVLERNAIRGGEKGTAGVLLGRIENGQRRTFIVEDSEPFPVPAHRGPSDSPFGEHQEWESVVSRWRSGSGKRISILGFYRSCAGGKKALDQHDLAILKANSTEFEQVFLLIEPHVDRAGSGFLFMASDGNEVWKWNEVPFSRNELARRGAGHPLAKPKLEDRPLQSQDSEVEKNQGLIPGFKKGLESSSSIHGLLGASTGVAIIIAIIISLRGGQVFHTFANRSEVANESALGLKTQRYGTDLQVSWDRSAPVFLKATAGHLSITDGDVRKNVDLDLSELRTGSISYSPITDDVALRLDVVNRESATMASESVRVVAGMLPPMPDHARTIGGASNLRTRPVQATPLTPAPAVVPANSKNATHAAEPAAARSLLAELARPTSGDASTAHRVAERTEHEDVALISDLNTEVREVSSPPALVSPPAPPKSETKASQPPVELPSPRSAPRAVEQNKHLDPAKLLFGSDPPYPDLAKRMRLTGTVKVDFMIGSDGKVRSISTVTGPALLTDAVVEAVKARRYSPARLNGTPVESELGLAFVFKLN